MARPSTTVTRVTPADVPDLTTLWLAAAISGGLSPEVASRMAGDGRIAAGLDRPGTRAYIARHDGCPAGYAVVNVRTHGLVDSPSVAVDELFVLPDRRRRGVAKALLGAVATFAEQKASEVVLCNVLTTDKSTNRYFARLGFGAAVTRRVIPTTVLRRRVSNQEAGSVERVIGRRRTLRARANQAGATALPRLVTPLTRHAG